MASLKYKDITTGEWKEVAGGIVGMLPSIYDPQGKQTDIFEYTDDKIAAISTPDVSGQIAQHDESATAHMEIQSDFLQSIQDSELRTLQTVNARISAAVANVPTGTVNGHTEVTIVGGDGIEIMTMVTPDVATGRSSSEMIISATAQGSGVTVHTTTIGTTWTEDEDTGVKSQNVGINGVLASHTATVDHMFAAGTEYADFVEAENQYLTYITNGYAETYDGGITFHIFGDAPTVAIPIVVEVV